MLKVLIVVVVVIGEGVIASVRSGLHGTREII